MLKIRLQGTTNDIKWFKKILERDKRITVLDISETYEGKDHCIIYSFICGRQRFG